MVERFTSLPYCKVVHDVKRTHPYPAYSVLYADLMLASSG
ncbi:hypothetical protein JC221_171 [Yersinia phage JC221]|nr:hypothetical protein JC221_171 [Yersinia phage JC221]